jgi:hypothetical protein
MDLTQRVDINRTVMTGAPVGTPGGQQTVAMSAADMGRTTAMAPVQGLTVEVVAGRTATMANGPAREQYLLVAEEPR